jgi:heat shock protein HslJ
MNIEPKGNRMNIKTLKTLFVLSLLALALTACSGKNADLEGTSWQLVDFAGKPLVSNYIPTLSFEEGRVGGNASCNIYGGEYKVNGDKIELGMMMSTMMACADNAAMTQEQEYLALLGTVEKWEVKNGQLWFFNAAGDALVFDIQK